MESLSSSAAWKDHSAWPWPFGRTMKVMRQVGSSPTAMGVAASVWTSVCHSAPRSAGAPVCQLRSFQTKAGFAVSVTPPAASNFRRRAGWAWAISSQAARSAPASMVSPKLIETWEVWNGEPAGCLEISRWRRTGTRESRMMEEF
jgi:hypothetical protein